jgi:Domain of unknown function (DUF4145)
MAWAVRDIELDRDIIHAIERHDDRSAAILAQLYLEDRATSTLKAHLGEDRPFANFASKIDSLHAAGIFEKQITDILHVIRKIRNAFAHELASLTFDTPCISELCSCLFSIEFLRGFRSWIEIQLKLHPELLTMSVALVDSMLAAPNTPRNSYMNTVKMMLMLLELAKLTALMKNTDTLEIVRGKTS